MMYSNNAMTAADAWNMARPQGYRTQRRLDIQPHDHTADTQDVQRERRRKGLTVELDARFILSNELAAVLSELLDDLRSEPQPGRWTEHVNELSHALCEVLTVITKAVGGAARSQHADDVPPESIAGGSWAEILVQGAKALDEPLRDALARGVLFNTEPIRDVLLAQLRAMDQAVTNVARDLRRVQFTRNPPGLPLEYVSQLRMISQLRVRHQEEMDALRERQRAEMAAVSHA